MKETNSNPSTNNEEVKEVPEEKTDLEIKVEYLMALSKSCDDWMAIANSEEPSEADLKVAKGNVQDALSRYNRFVSTCAYKRWHESEAPIRNMLTERYIPEVKRVNFRQSKKTGLWKVTLSDLETLADLTEYADLFGYGDFESPDWWVKCQKMAYLLAGAASKDLRGSTRIEYEISIASQMFEFSADANPQSKTSRKKAMQIVFDAILKGVKANDYDVAYLEMAMSERSGCGKIEFCNAIEIAEFVADAMHTRLTGKQYDLTFHK